jgi:hypothetical protein
MRSRSCREREFQAITKEAYIGDGKPRRTAITASFLRAAAGKCLVRFPCRGIGDCLHLLGAADVRFWRQIVRSWNSVYIETLWLDGPIKNPEKLLSLS